MELGNFLGKLKGEKKAEPKKFLALVLTDEVVQAAVWSVVNEVTEIVSIGAPVEWDGDTGTTSELVTAVDATISSATEGLTAEPTEVILGIPHTWTDKNGILGVKRDFIKNISKELELKTLGFVVISDSILSYLKMQEGTPATSILIQVARDELTLILVRLGQIEAVEVVGRSDDEVVDVTEGIIRFKVMDNLPSRIILFNAMHNLDDMIQNLLSVNWQAQFNFLHIPKIEALAKDVVIRALAVAGGSEVAKSLGFTVSEIVPVGVDPRVDPPAQSPESSLLTAEEIGFVSPPKREKIDFIDPEDDPIIESVGVDPRVDPQPHAPFVMPTIKLPKLHFPKIKFNFSSSKPHWWYVGGGILALSLLIFWFLWILPVAVVTVNVLPKVLEQDVDITLSTTSTDIDFSQKVIPAQVSSITETGEKILETTGKKTVGESSSGNVTIFNRTASSKTFTKGTILTSGSLKFTLDGDVTVASKSAGSDYVDVPGKAAAKIVAASIGDASNLPSGSEFTISSFGKDSYVGKNDSALTGGTSQEVQVVSKDDQTSLTSDLTKELLQKIEDQGKVNNTSGTGVYLIADSAKVEDVTYSAKVGEPGKTITATLTVKATLLKYKTDDVTTLVNSAIDDAVPANYVRANIPSTVDLAVSTIGEDEATVKGKAKVAVSLLPIFDKHSLQNNLKGKSVTEIGNILSQVIGGYQNATVLVTPGWLPTKLKSIPRNANNIEVIISPVLK